MFQLIKSPIILLLSKRSNPGHPRVFQFKQRP